MDGNIALEVRFDGETQIYNPSIRTSWEDLIAMLKCSFDSEDISVYYVDDEDDEIGLDTQEEYNEAKRVAHNHHNVIRLRVYRKDQRMEVDKPTFEGTSVDQSSADTNTRKRVYNPETQPDPPSQPIPIPAPTPILAVCPPMPPPRPKVPPRLNRTSSLPAHKQQASVTGCVMKAVEELKQLNASQNDQPDAPIKETELIDQIVKGVLEGLNGSTLERTRSRSWDPSQGLDEPRVPWYSPSGTRPKTRASGTGQGLKLEHTGVTCNNCETTIFGFRYKCGHCLNFDLCEECEALSGVHDPNHVFLKLKRPAYRVGMKSDGRFAPIFKHPIYADDDTPVWDYKIKKLEEKIARKAARAELKRKYREEKRRVKVECHGQVSPTKRERIEKMAEKQAEQIMAAASVAATPTTASTETTPLLVQKFDAGFVKDGNLPDDTHMQPMTKFLKSWILINNGNVRWNSDTKLKHLWGDIKILSPEPTDIPPLSPGEEGPICVDFEAPAEPGRYQSHWRLTQKGEQFGHRVWCNIAVDKAEILEPRIEKRRMVQEAMILPEAQENLMVQTDSSNENTPSSAVAHLKSDQSDCNSASRLVSSSDMLTAQDVFSFELLSIRDDQDADKEVAGVNSPAATGTPNNTPIVGLTPCISPIPQLDEKLLCRRVSEHSELEIIRREDIPDIIETRDTVRDGPILREAGVGIEIARAPSETEEDVESICSSSDSDMLDDYCVVPLPDCFDPSKPLDKSLIMSRTSLSSSMTSSRILPPSSDNAPLVRLPSYEESQAESQSIESISTSSEDSSTPLSSSPIPEPQALSPAPEAEGVTRGACDDANTTPELSDIGTVVIEILSYDPPREDSAPPSEASSVDALLSTSNPALETTPLIPLVAATPIQQVVTTAIKSSSPPPQQTVTMAPMPEITLLASPATVPTLSGGGVLINPEGSVVYEARSLQDGANCPEVVSETRATPMAGTNDETNVDSEQDTTPQAPEREGERIDEHDDEFHDAQDTPNNNENQFNDVTYEQDPVELLGYTAARAVEVAGSVVRQAFDTAASSVNALLRPQPIPMPAPYGPTSPAPFQPPSPSSMDQLIEMGFGDRAKNQELLEKYNDNVSRCVQDLLQAEDNNWQNNRH